MRALSIVHKGLEKIEESNIHEILGKSSKNFSLGNSVVLFDAEDIEDLIRLTYFDQLASRILLFITELSDLDNPDRKVIENAIKSFDFLENIETFRVKCEYKGYDPTEIEKEFGNMIFEILQKKNPGLKVDLKNPEITFYIHVGIGENHDIDSEDDSENIPKSYIGIDFSGDLAKRDYKIFNSSRSLKGTVAFGLLRLAGYAKDDVLLDIVCNDGIIPIEAALYSTHTSQRQYNKDFPFKRFLKIADEKYEKMFSGFDKERYEGLKIIAADPLLANLTAAKKNAKIAGIEKKIEFRRIDHDWLDIKFEKASIDKIITFIPGIARYDKGLVKDFEEIFYMAEYILKKTGTIAIMCINPELLVESSKKFFKIVEEKKLFSGDQPLTVLIFSR